MDAVAPFNLEKIYLNSAPEDDADAAWLDKFYESAGWRPLEPRRGPHRWFVYHGSDDSKRIRMMGVDDLSMARPADIFERRTPTAIGPGAYAKRVLTHYARKTPERIRNAIAAEITRRYNTTDRLDLMPVTAAEVVRHLVAAASAQASREAPVAYGTQDADRVWEHRRNEILLDWGLASSMLPPRAM